MSIHDPLARAQAYIRKYAAGSPAEEKRILNDLAAVNYSVAHLLSALQALADDIPYHADADSCECVDFVDDGACCHQQAFAVLAAVAKRF